MGGVFIQVDVKRVLADVCVNGTQAAEFGSGAVHGMKCWAAGTVGECCPVWIRDAWVDGVANNRRGVRAPSPAYRYYGADWPAIRSQIISRDRCCLGCGEPRGLDVHHRIPFRSFASPEEANDPSNLVALCRGCHASADAAYRRDGSVFPLPEAAA